jgi:acyl carrier protein
MVPARFVELDTLPRTPNGKVDRRALPGVEKVRPELEQTFVPLRSGIERRIAAVWQAVLGIDTIGAHDNFFDLGGQSLLLVRVHSQLRRELDPGLDLIDLFRYPTVAQLAEHLARGGEAGREEPPELDEQLERRQVGQRRQRAGLALRRSLDETEGSLP